MRFPAANGNGNGPEAAGIIALRALIWVLEDNARADRLLALTGLDADQLRSRAADSTTGIATLDFLGAHEPDLLACAAALDLPPERLMQAARELAQ